MRKTKAVSQLGKGTLWDRIIKDRQLLIILLPGLVFYLIFRYAPMFGVIIAFKDYSPFLGVFKSPWADNFGFEHFIKFFSSNDFIELFRNTLLLGVSTLLWSFPITIIFALLLNEVKVPSYKKTVQTISYLPTFLSVVIICSMTIDFLSPNNGLVNKVLQSLGMEKIYFMTDPLWFRTIYVVSGIWASLGSGAIIYLAALSGVDQALYEAARIDGCKRVKMMWHITIPSIMPTIVTMFILSAGNILKIGADKVILLYNPMTYETADVFGTYVYRRGMEDLNFSFASAVGIFESVVACLILYACNKLSSKYTGESLW